MKFRTTILQGGKNITGIHVPDEVVEALGAAKRPPVRVTLGAYTYRNTIAAVSVASRRRSVSRIGRRSKARIIGPWSRACGALAMALRRSW